MANYDYDIGILGGKQYSAKTWVIATGSSPAIPPIQGLDNTAYITNKEVYSLENLPQSMIILISSRFSLHAF